MKLLKYFAWTLAPVLMIAALVTAGAAQEINSQLAAGAVLEKIKERGLMKIGHSTFIPWAMRDKKGGLIGFEIDVAKRLAKNMEVKVEFLTTPFDGIIPALLSRQVRHHHHRNGDHYFEEPDGELHDPL